MEFSESKIRSTNDACQLAFCGLALLTEVSEERVFSVRRWAGGLFKFWEWNWASDSGVPLVPTASYRRIIAID